MQADSLPSELPGKPWSWLVSLFLFLIIIQWLHAKINNLCTDKYWAFIVIHLQIVGILVLESFHTYNYLERVLRYFEQYSQLVGGFKKIFLVRLKKMNSDFIALWVVNASFQFLGILWDLFYGPTYGQFLQKFHVFVSPWVQSPLYVDCFKCVNLVWIFYYWFFFNVSFLCLFYQLLRGVCLKCPSIVIDWLFSLAKF